MKLSIVIATRNRRDALARTLARLTADGALAGVEPVQIIVVDDASHDDTAPLVRERFPHVELIALHRQRGACAARNAGIAAARGEHVLFLDDDSHPRDDAATRIVRYLDANPRTAAVVGRVERADGSTEASALPSVMIACAACVRKRVLDEVGGFPPEFVRQAEEYDLSFRIWQAGHRIERFEDLVFTHEKADGGRASATIQRLDVRNNLILAARHLPPELARAYREDWTLRYAALARHQGQRRAARRGQWQGRLRTLRERWRRGRRWLDADALESIFGFEQQRHAIDAWARHHRLRRVAIADFGKNLYATYRACLANGLKVRAILEGNGAFAGLWYRGVEIVPDAVAGACDGVVLSNVNPAQLGPRMAQLRRRLPKMPLLALWEPRVLGDQGADGDRAASAGDDAALRIAG